MEKNEELLDYKTAKELADEFVKEIINFCDKIEICGSIRRKKAKCRDIDLVVLPKEGVVLRRKLPLVQTWCINHFITFKIIKEGDKHIQLKYKDVQVDIYIATPENFEVLKLIRTGADWHNKKLCGLAINKGMRMKFDRGLIDAEGKIVANTEEGILKELLGKYVPPEGRGR